MSDNRDGRRGRRRKVGLRACGSAIAAMVLGLGIAACGDDDDGGATAAAGTAGAAATAQAETTTLKVPLPAASGWAWLPALASEQGLDKKHGLELKMVTTTTDAPSYLATFSSNQVDIGPGSAILFAGAMKQGLKVKFLNMGNYNLDLSLIARPKLSLPNNAKGYPAAVADLKGKIIGVGARGGLAELFVVQALKDAGLTAKDVNFVAVAGPAAISAFKVGRIDALVAPVPSEEVFGEGNFQTVVSREDMLNEVAGPTLLYTGFVVRDEIAKDEPDAVKGFCQTIQDALAFAKDPANRDAVTASFGKQMGLEGEAAAAAWDKYSSLYNLALDQQQWENQPEGFVLPPWNEGVTPQCSGA